MSSSRPVTYGRDMKSSRVTVGLSLVLAVTGLALAGCGSPHQEPQVASAGGTPTASVTTAAADVVAAYLEGVRAYVTCLRAEGLKVTDPDPRGKIEFEGDLKLLKADPKFAAAQQKCSSLLPPVPAGLQDRPVKTAAQIEVTRRYAACMRENGAPDFPDPGPDGYFPDRSAGEPTWDQTSDGARRATRTCATIIGDPSSTGPGQG